MGVDDQLQLARLHDRQIRRLRALEDAGGIDADLTKCIRRVASIADKPANFSRFRIMLPAPRQKAPQISPIFKADTMRLHVSREKDKEIALVDAGWDDKKVVQPDGCGSSEGWILPPDRGSDDPPFKN